MVKQVYFCEECNFVYNKEEQAKQCEEFCREHKSCSIEITKNSVGELR